MRTRCLYLGGLAVAVAVGLAVYPLVFEPACDQQWHRWIKLRNANRSPANLDPQDLDDMAVAYGKLIKACAGMTAYQDPSAPEEIRRLARESRIQQRTEREWRDEPSYSV